MKLLRPGADALARARLAREAAVLSSIDHPAIGWLLDAGEADGEPYLAFTLYEAGTLAARIDRGRVPAHEVAAALAPIAEALAYVHERGIVHRDVKPANVLCAPDGPVLVDFSIASITGSTYDGWIDGAPAVAGTEGYRAPEAGTVAPSAAEDVYALGISIAEAVSGARGVVIDAVLGPLEDVVHDCLAADPSTRPRAADVARALRVIAADTPPPVEPPPSEFAEIAVTVPVTERFATRAGELGRLVASVEDGVDADELRGVVVVAPAGAGKTWLIEHAVARAMGSRSDARVLAARCSDAVGDASVLRPWLRPLLDRERDPVASLATIVGRAPALQVAHALGLVRGGGVDGDTGVVADAIASILASMGVVVCIVEDLHHASLELLDLLARLSQRSGVPGAMWCTTRPGFVDPDDLDFETLALSPLDDDAISAVVADVIGDDTATVVQQVLAVAGGNPLHAREAALAARRGDGSALQSLGTLPELIADRFAHMGDDARDALEVAAACGDSFWPEAVGGPLLAETATLYQSGVAQVRMTSAIAGSTEAGWSHPLLQEVAYSSMPLERRRALHAHLGSVLEGVAADAEVVARQAGLAFRLGDVASAPLAGRSAASAARDALDRFALSGAASWVELLRDSGHEPVAGCADVLDAELRIARGEFDSAARLVRPLTTRDDDIGAQALVLATEATAGAGDFRAAERFGEAARTRLGDDPRLATNFGPVLARRGRLEDALQLLDAATENARVAGNESLAARLAAQAADIAAQLARAGGQRFDDATRRTRAALAELRDIGDRREFARAVRSLMAIIEVDEPINALEIVKEAAQDARSIGDDVLLARLAFQLCDTALDLGDRDELAVWLPMLDNSALDGVELVQARLLRTVVDAASTTADDLAPPKLFALARELDELGLERPFAARFEGLCALLWQGRVAEAVEREDDVAQLPNLFRSMTELHACALGGPPWDAQHIAVAEGTSMHNEVALLHLLRGDHSTAEALLVERYRDRIVDAGHAFQRFTPVFPGALVAALGPSETDPDVAWLIRCIREPVFPGLWVVHRAIAALLLAERRTPPVEGLANDALELLARVPADAPVRAWIIDRAQALL